ncbi:MAG: sigma-70 family RNA polymerase sigma factor [Tenuifilaceae bacterium]|nr:sigma-70 family RNA polymerase sigma factor [Bacteroidales bacterium]MDX9846711.1 sigma-70 family RNA polymerase sigma factor [Tenuifilaceae bacterium]
MEISRNILERCCESDRKAQQALYTIYAPTMYGVCLRYYPNTDIARDILQDGFVKVFENISSFRFEGSFEGWMRKIMVNTALEYHRKKTDGREVQINGEFIGLEVFDHLDADYHNLLAIVAELPQQYRLVFNLYAIEGYSHAEIASMLSITESTSKSNYSRARAILREKVSQIEKQEAYAVIRARAI